MKKFLLTCALTVIIGSTFTSYGQSDVKLIAEGDFTTLTEGSPESPVAFPSFGTGSFSQLFPSWGQSKVKQAGGQLLIEDMGYVRTPSTDMSAYNGTVKITARIRMRDDYGGAVKMSVGYSSSQTLIFEDTEWHDISVIMAGGSSYSYVRLEPFLSAAGLLVQTLKVEQSATFIAAPEALQPNQADGTSFTARWNSVKGATGYYLDVYSYNSDNSKQYVIENKAIDGSTSTYKVTGLDASKKYYFVVRATNGDGTSTDSNEIRVVKVIYYLSAPANVAVNTNENSFTATWDAVTDAESYFVNVSQSRLLADAENVEMLNEDFSKITSGAFDNIDFIINSDLDPYTQTPGWSGNELGKSAGQIVLTPLSGAEAFLNTPLMDLSSNNGNCTVSFNMALAAYGKFYSGGTATVYIADEQGNKLSTKTVTFNSGFETYTVNLTGGTNNCRIGILYNDIYKIFIDSMTVSQEKPAGSVITSLLCEEEVQTNSFSKTIDKVDRNITYNLNVTAAAETVRSTDIVPIYSEPSNTVTFTLDTNAGTPNTETAAVRIYSLGNGRLGVETSEPIEITVYDISGSETYRGTIENSGIIDTRNSGISIVKAGNRIFKICL